MSNSIMVNVKPTFNMEIFSKKLADTYVAKGYTVNVANMNNSCILTVEKGVGGINFLLGMDEGIKATITQNESNLIISFSDAEWTGKIVGLAVGWFLCFVPFFTAIAGIIKQTSLPKSIGNDATMIASSL